MSVRRRTTGLVAVWGVLACATVVVPGAVAADADGCSNAAIRALQGASQVPDCRSFELVSPVDKANTDVDGRRIQSAVQPGVVAFGASGTMPGSVASVGTGVFRAERAEQGWTTRSMDLPQLNTSETVAMSTRFVSRDLSMAFGLSRRALAPGAVEGNGNAYAIDARTGALRLIATSAAGITRGLFKDHVLPTGLRLLGTPNMDHLVFTTDDQLLPGTRSDQQNMYEWHDGRLRLVSVFPDGSTTLANASTGVETNALDYRRAISDDGSRIVFQDTGFHPSAPTMDGSAALFVRIDGRETKLISHYQRSGFDATVPQPASFVGASADGSVVIFSSNRPLIEGDDARQRLFRYDAATGAISQLVDFGPGTDDAWLQTSLGVSADGGRVYFLAIGDLDVSGNDGIRRMYVWDHGTVKRIAEGLDPNDAFFYSWAMSPNGRFASFVSSSHLLGRDNTSSDCHPPAGQTLPLEGTCQEAYAYDAVSGALTCLSCPVEGRSSGHAGNGFHYGLLGQVGATAVLDDGTFLFDTPNALVPDDINGRRDVYEWTAGSSGPRLVTTGTGVADAVFGDASADGTDVYFTTTNRMVGVDRDDLADLYTARRNGGFVSQNPPESPVTDCVGEGCRGPRSPTPEGEGVGSSLVRGAGDVPLVQSVPAARVVVSARRRVVGRTATLRVRVSGAGTVSVRGQSLRAARRVVAKAATCTVRLSLTPSAVRAVGRRGAVTARARVTFRPRSGRAVSKTVVLRFERAKGGR